MNKVAFLPTVIQLLQDVIKAKLLIHLHTELYAYYLLAEMTNSFHESYPVLIHLDFWLFTFDVLNFRLLETPYEILQCQESWPNISSVNTTEINISVISTNLSCNCNLADL